MLQLGAIAAALMLNGQRWLESVIFRGIPNDRRVIYFVVMIYIQFQVMIVMITVATQTDDGRLWKLKTPVYLLHEIRNLLRKDPHGHFPPPNP